MNCPQLLPVQTAQFLKLLNSQGQRQENERDRATIVIQLSNGLKSPTMPARMETQHLPDISASYRRKSRPINDVISA